MQTMKMDLQRFAEALVDPSQGMLSKGTTLGYKEHAATGDYTLMHDIKTVPEIGQSPEKVDVTSLEDDKKKAIDGLQDSSSLAFVGVYKGENFKLANQIAESRKIYDWKVTYPDGLTATFVGKASVKLGQAGINEALSFTVTVVVSDGPDYTVPTGTTGN
ncbi:phage tail tube protein [Lacticaseibacillus saniviri]